MSTAKITLIGLYNYDPTIFDKMVLPLGIEKVTLRDNILFRSADFEVMFADPDFLREAIGLWSKKWSRTFEKWVTALSLEYDPISNYDRHEEWQTDDTGSQSSQSSDTSSASVSGTSTDKVSAYNSSTFENDKENTSSNTSGSSANSNLSGSHSNKEVRKGRAWGNIGVMTTQQMLQSELDIASWNLYEHITDIFLNEFIIPVY